MTRYVLVFVIAVAGMFACSEGWLLNPFRWDSQLEISGALSGEDARQIHFAVQKSGGGTRYPLTGISRPADSDVVYATYSRIGGEVPGTGGLICSSGTTYTLAKRGGKWRVISTSMWMT